MLNKDGGRERKVNYVYRGREKGRIEERDCVILSSSL